MTKRKMTIASFCAMTCAEGAFHKFLDERYSHIYEPIEVGDKELAAHIVKQHCCIRSRSELNKDRAANARWQALKAEYDHWRRT